MNDRLVILGDLLRVDPAWGFHQKANIIWFENVLRESLGCHFHSVQTCCDPVSGFPFEEFYKQVYQDRTLDPETAWAALFDTNLSEEAVKLLDGWIDNRFALIFEGSPSLIRALSKLGISTLNTRVHPYRCGDDLFLTCSSNNPLIAERLKQAQLHQRCFEDMSKKIARRYGRAELALGDSCLIFLAQTDRDAILIENGEFFTLASAAEKVIKLAQERRLFHKPHPHALNGRLVREWRSLFPDSIELGPDLYQLLATNHQLTFITASSGSAFEAETFGHITHYLMTHHWGPAGGLSDTDRVLPRYYWDPCFWDFILNGNYFKSVISDDDLPSDRLRNIVNYNWAPLTWRK